MMKFLPLEKSIITESSRKSSIIIVAKGISLSKCIQFMVSMYDNDYSLALVLNMHSVDREILPNVVDLSKKHSRTRSMYLGNNIVTGTSTCIVADIINNILPIEKVSIVFVLNAEHIKRDSSIAFISYLFHQQNSLHNIKVFINEIHTKEIEAIQEMFCCNRFLLYPYFHDVVQESRSEHFISIVDVKTPNIFLEISTLIIDILRNIRINYIEAFHSNVFSFTTAGFKQLLILLHNADAVSVYNFYKSMVDIEKQREDEESWVYCTEAIVLLDITKKYADSVLSVVDDSEDFNRTNPFLTELVICTQQFEDDSEGIGVEISSSEGSQENTGSSKLSEHVFSDKTHFFNSAAINSIAKFKGLHKIISGVKELVETVIIVQNSYIKRVLMFWLDINKVDPVDIFTHGEFRNNNEKPYSTVILLNYNLATIRYLELYYKQDVAITVLNHRKSLEEEIYLQSIEREIQTFDTIIERRNRLPLISDFYTNSRLDRANDDIVEITIDTREFRSPLPFYLYRSLSFAVGISLLKTGDYILQDKQILIERKEINDLKGSLKSGRLYRQACRYFHYLLLEFGSDKLPCISEPFYIKLLCQFINYFENTRLIWSNSHLFTIEMFHTVCHLRPPIQTEECDDELLNILLDIPGMNLFYAKRIVNKFINLYDLAFCPIESLYEIMDRKRAETIFMFFRKYFK